MKAWRDRGRPKLPRASVTHVYAEMLQGSPARPVHGMFYGIIVWTVFISKQILEYIVDLSYKAAVRKLTAQINELSYAALRIFVYFAKPAVYGGFYNGPC